MLHQRLSQKLLQKLSPQQIQLMKLLQVPTANLEQRIKEELEINPALEESISDFDNDKEDLTEPEQIRDDEDDNYEESNDEDDFADSLDVQEYTKDDFDYNNDDSDYSGKEEKKSTPFAVGKTFHDFLNEQLHLLELDDIEWQIADQLIGSIDDDGYLRRDLDAIVDDLAFQKNVTTTVQQIEDVLRTIHRFDPPGVGARNLQECLQVQLERREQNANVKLALQIINTQFDAFTKKHYDKLMKALNIDEEQLKKALDVILHLNPKPGGTSSESTSSVNHHSIIPDFTVENNNGELEVLLNGKNAPDLRISDSFKEMLTSYGKGSMKDKKQKEAVVFIKQKIDAAKWFIDAIKQRQHTLFVTMEAIVDFQKDYFLSGDEMKLRPMILKDIAEITGLDISTVSRVANSKYCQTEFGVFSLKHFFSEGLQTEGGEEVSTREVKKILEDLINNEDKSKPFSDEFLTDQLKAKGYNIARRTVAKYREQLNIPVARLRKEL